MNKFCFIVSEEFEAERIDSFVNKCIDDISRSYIKKCIKEGAVKINNETVLKPSMLVRMGDEVEINVPDTIEPDIEPEDIPLDILYEDMDLLVVNKPKGMVVHPAPGHYSGTLVNAVMFHCKGQLSGINGVMRPGIVHRIDKDTSGSLIICKNDLAHNSIAMQLKEHSLKRIYHAIVYGNIKQEEGIVEAPIGRDPKNRLKMAVIPNGKEAITHYKVIKRMPGFTYVSFRLETGRTHQIRVHMSHIGHPILGDSLYAVGRTCNLKSDGQTLHAKTIGFIHPRTGEYMEFDTKLPEYFAKYLDILDK